MIYYWKSGQQRRHRLYLWKIYLSKHIRRKQIQQLYLLLVIFIITSGKFSSTGKESVFKSLLIQHLEGSPKVLLTLLQKFCIKLQLNQHFNSHRRKTPVWGSTDITLLWNIIKVSISNRIVVKLLCRKIRQLRPFLLLQGSSFSVDKDRENVSAS